MMDFRDPHLSCSNYIKTDDYPTCRLPSKIVAKEEIREERPPIKKVAPDYMTIVDFVHKI